MACAGLLLVLLASVTLQIPGAVRGNTEQSLPPPAPSPAASPGKPINLSLNAIHIPAMLPSGTDIKLQRSDVAPAATAPAGIRLGPLRTEFGGITGRHLHLATVRLEGISIFGGSIGGSIDSRSARITLSWPTGN